MAARLGAPALSEEDGAAMRTYIAQLRAVQQRGTGDLTSYLRLQWEMQDVCYVASGHLRLVREIRSYRRQAERYLRLALGKAALMAEDFTYEQSYLDACLTKDGTKAESMLRVLMEWTVDRVGERLGELQEGG
jgi:DNA-binding GntR family transcriptional regulator